MVDDIFLRVAERKRHLRPEKVKELTKNFDKPDAKATFDKRDINRNRQHMVFTSQDKLMSGKLIRMYYMYADGALVGEAGVGALNRRLYNVKIDDQFRGQKLAHRLMAYVMNLEDPPTNLIAKSTNPNISDAQLVRFYEQFGFKRVHNPKIPNSIYMEHRG